MVAFFSCYLIFFLNITNSLQPGKAHGQVKR